MLFSRLIFVLFATMCVSSHVAAVDSNGVSIHTIQTAVAKPNFEALIVEGGSLFSMRQLVHNAILIQHPNGTLLYDTGLGTNTDEAFQELGLLDRLLFGYEDLDPAVFQLKKAGIKPSDITAIIPSHLHWDHTGGIEDFPGVPVWVQKDALEFAKKETGISYLPKHIDDPDINWHFFSFNQTPYASFEKSVDFFGDGSVVLVHLPGHTLGQVGLFVTGNDERKFLFIGDTTWVLKGIQNQKPRPWLTRWFTGVDLDADLNDEQIKRVKEVQETVPGLIIIPAHDESTAKLLPTLLPRYD